MGERYELVGTSVLSTVDRITRKNVFASVFDEQLKILDVSGRPFSGVEYSIRLGNGKVVRGLTQSDGRTERVITGSPVSIESVEIAPSPRVCCALHAGAASESLVISVQGVKTTSSDVGQSIRVVETPKGSARGLTSGEIRMAETVFGGGVDYEKVRVHRGGYWLFFGLQDEDTAVTPNGEMYFPGKHYKEDYSLESVRDQGWFLHEMTHVWQYQMGYWVKLVRGPRPNMSYAYSLEPGKRFSDFNMEAQGNIIEDYYLAVVCGSQRLVRESKYRSRPDTVSSLKATLAEFLKDPKNEGLLPNTTE